MSTKVKVTVSATVSVTIPKPTPSESDTTMDVEVVPLMTRSTGRFSVVTIAPDESRAATETVTFVPTGAEVIDGTIS